MWIIRILFVQIFLYGFGWGEEPPENMFTENGHRIGYASDEEAPDVLSDRDQERGTEYIGNVDDEEATQEKSIRKRAGQQEFATFVAPDGNGYKKRAVADGWSTNDGGNASDTVFVATTAVCTAAAVFGILAAAFVWRRVHKRHKEEESCEYPSYGITGPTKERSGGVSPVAAMDAKLASTAHLYHYQHTKQQILAMEQSASEKKGHDSDDSDGEEEEGEFSVYEYPGLASTGDMEVSNPLFDSIVTSPLPDPKSATLQSKIHQHYQEKEE